MTLDDVIKTLNLNDAAADYLKEFIHNLERKHENSNNHLRQRSIKLKERIKKLENQQ